MNDRWDAGRWQLAKRGMKNGASRCRIVRQLFTESLLLAVAGAAGGVLLAAWGTTALPALAPAGLPRIDQIGLDERTLLFTLAVALLTGVVLVLSRPCRCRGTDRTSRSRKTAGVHPLDGRLASETDSPGARIVAYLSASTASSYLPSPASDQVLTPSAPTPASKPSSAACTSPRRQHRQANLPDEPRHKEEMTHKCLNTK